MKGPAPHGPSMPDPWTKRAGRGDWLSEDQPQDKLNRLLHPGQHNFGFPYCDGGDIPDPQFGWGHSCDEFTKPIAQLGPHTATLGMRFYTGKMFPKEYRNAIFITGTGARKLAPMSSSRGSTRTGGHVDRAVHHRVQLAGCGKNHCAERFVGL
jgi:glucose/arabinose dehydrogenase